jgi:hypothetical protein
MFTMKPLSPQFLFELRQPALTLPSAPEYSLPDPPQFATVAGQGCAIKCREADYDSKMACRGTKDEQLECVSECNQELDRCYKLCMEILE